MAVQFVVCTGSVALVAATAKTVIEIPTGALQGFVVIGLEVSFSAAAAGSAVVEWGTYTTTGTGTTVTATKYGPITDGPAAALGTVKVADSVEPTSFVTTGNLPSWVIPLPGMYSILYPAGREFYRPASTLSALRINSTLACNARVNLYIEQ
jgi:hypothetical protein